MLSAAAIREISPVDRQTLGDRVYGELRELLISGRVAPGERLSLRDSARALGVSIMPVREAVSRLVADRALEVAPNRAVRVPVMTVSQFRELTELRIEIEGFAAARAARVRGESDLAGIAAAESAFRAEAASARPDLCRAVSLNKSLHFAVYAAAAMPMLMEIIGGLWLKAGPVLNLDLRANPERLAHGVALQRHAEVVAAIRARDGPAARKAIAGDIASAAEFIIEKGGLAQG